MSRGQTLFVVITCIAAVALALFISERMPVHITLFNVSGPLGIR